MEYLVYAEIEIDGEKIDDFSSISLRQKFNEHHEFAVRLDYDILESDDVSLGLNNVQKTIGKSIILRFGKAEENREMAYEFKGIICEVRLEQSNKLNPELVLTGYSPTILLEGGPDLTSFYKQTLEAIVSKVTKPAGSACTINNNPKYKKEIPYICQYRESAYNFLNRLSSELGEYFFYDGKNLNFGKPSSQKKIQVINGEDVSSLQLSLKALPVNFSSYSFQEKDETFFSEKSPASIQGLGQYSGFLFKESKNMFSTVVKEPSNVHAESSSDLGKLIQIKQAAIAANLEVLTATSYNPGVHIGSIVSLKISTYKNGNFSKYDYGEFLVVAIDHVLTESGGYYNNFEAVPSSLDVVPVTNFTVPVAETQIAQVLKNDDEEKMGRVKVQMLWQKADGLSTDWIRVMTPDAGSGNDGKNRGLVTIPEVGDQVMVGFRYNDPDRPFVLGSVFTGKTGEGGGDKNEIKSFTTYTGSTVKFEKDKISIIDAKKKSKILFDGEGKLKIESDEEINLTCGQSSISLKKDGTIEIKGKEITVDASSKATVKAMSGVDINSTGGDVKVQGLNTEVSGQIGAKVSGNATAELSAGGQTTVKGAVVMIN
jgi:uncharacterized protein involved in type VI secretion and phage assembly